MKKKFLCLLLVFVFALSVFTTVHASSRDRELTNELELIDVLNGLDLIGDFEFFLLEDIEYTFGTRNDELELLYFDSIEDFVMHLDAVTLALREEWVFSISEDESAMQIASQSSSDWLWDDLNAPSGIGTRFNIQIRYMFHPNRIGLHSSVITSLSITDSWFSGLTLGARWTHRQATAHVTQATSFFTDYRFSVSGTLFQGVVIGGQEIGYTTNEVITGGFWAHHSDPNARRPLWPGPLPR